MGRFYSALHALNDRGIMAGRLSDGLQGFRDQMAVSRSSINRLGLDAELDGHEGCVNTIEFNETGSLLLSGSDDLCLCLWDPHRKKLLRKIKSHHSGNIFTAKFVAGHSDNLLVSGAADCRVQLHDVTEGRTTRTFAYNGGRVKRICTTPSVENVFWVGAEDGTVMQYDLRDPSLSTSQRSPPIVLLNLNAHCGPHVEVKCLAINHHRPELLAVGCNDPYIRVYDRRNLSPKPLSMPTSAGASSGLTGSEEEEVAKRWSSPAEWSVPECAATYFAAGHLPSKEFTYRRSFRQLSVTYLTFSPDGQELLANCGGEQIYLFNVNQPRLVEHFRPPPSAQATSSQNAPLMHRSSKFVEFAHFAEQFAATERPDKTTLGDLIKDRANQYYSERKYPLSIQAYNQALTINPHSAVLWANRAAALIKRNWSGDVYQAARDCQRAIDLDPDYFKAYARLSRCLYDLNWTVESLKVLEYIKDRFDAEKFQQVLSFYKQVNSAVEVTMAGSGNSPTSGNDSDTASPLRRRLRRSESHRNQQDSSDLDEANSSFEREPSPLRRRRQGDNLSDSERTFRKRAFDFELMFSGHCNTTTDIKEANFFGSNYIVAGSDDGHFFIWERSTQNVVKILNGDESIVNCLQPAPNNQTCLLATSGIDRFVRLWTPSWAPDDGRPNPRVVSAAWNKVAEDNQRRMNADPLEVMLQSMGYRIVASEDDDPEGENVLNTNDDSDENSDDDSDHGADDLVGRPRASGRRGGGRGGGRRGDNSRLGCATS